ncbi:COBRA-like protein 7 [Triticum dicoccoides]|uniref:COBRA-like protein 7 n=1 Tax=Triticum dicoccoides TaxID=85692 RepID=UPI00188E07E6|nr:COBRA-like protein 7 [Triticum dicoccoides]
MEAMHARLALVFLLFVALAAAQPVPAPAPADVGCNGVFLTYTPEAHQRIRPFVDPAAAAAGRQPYSFSASATVLNNGVRTLPSWALLVAFAHGEILVSLDGAVLTFGDDLPYNTTAAGGGATTLSGNPQTDLLTPIATAGDLTRIQATVKLVGTLFAGPEPVVTLPSAISLADPAYSCLPVATAPSVLSACCVLIAPDQPSAVPPAAGNAYLPRVTGDLVITYDVLQAHETTYLALVTLENNAPMGRLDGWELSWEWRRGEFINSIRGAYPREVDTRGCLYGPQGQYYKDLDFSKVLNCERRPVVHDLPPSRRDDTSLGQIEHCCRNGTILPKTMDEAQSKSAFQMEVYKMPPDLNRTARPHAPANFRVAGASPLNQAYACGQPALVSPTEFPDPSGLVSTTLAVATWQAVCNMTVDDTKLSKPPQCCVSFSAFYNESVIPCSTCACGCPAPAAPTTTCSTTAPALLLPPHALLMPFEWRAKETLKWYHDEELGAPPNPMPCGDNCGVSVNWHVATDAAGGWSARVTLFNWEEGADMRDWFATVVMGDKVYGGFEQAYSFNATAVGDGAIFMRGREGFELLLRESNVSGVDYPVPGKQQSVLSFTKKNGPGDVDVVGGDGFPTKIFFNGEECAMPQMIPSQGAGIHANRRGALLILLLFFFFFFFFFL